MLMKDVINMFNEFNLKKIIFLFLITLPIFELQIFYNSFTTIIRMFIIIACLIWLLIVNKESRKYLKYLFVFYLLLFVYGIFHHLNALNFNSLVPGNFNYVWLKEILYLFKMTIPLLLFYLLHFVKFDKKEYIKIIKFWVLFICGVIIVTNIFEISLGSYSDSIIKGNIFDWFSTSLTYYDLASKGLFMYANQIGCLLILILPIVYYLYIKEQIKFYYLILLMISLLMLGTRIANIGGILVLLGLITLYLFLGLIKKHKCDFKISLYSLVLVICCALILPFSPTLNRYKIFNYILKSGNLEFAAIEVEFNKLDYIKNNYKDKEIYDLFILERYPYKYDPDFWIEILDEDYEDRVNYRHLEIAMLNRVVEINNNSNDVLFGITNVRVQNIFNVERDFLLQYYAYGIIGCIILLGFYYILFYNNLILMFKNFCFKNSIKFLITFLFLIISYLSGNILSQLSVPLMFIFLIEVE